MAIQTSAGSLKLILNRNMNTHSVSEIFFFNFKMVLHLEVSVLKITPPYKISWSYYVTTHLRLGLPSGLFPSGFPTNTMAHPYAFIQSINQSIHSFI
jgi:hypothetical protein